MQFLQYYKVRNTLTDVYFLMKPYNTSNKMYFVFDQCIYTPLKLQKIAFSFQNKSNESKLKNTPSY